MPIYKLTMKFVHTSAISNPQGPLHRTAGWTESWYLSTTSLSAALTFFNNGVVGPPPIPGLGPARAGLLCLGASISGVRIQSVSPPGPAQSFNVNYPGTAGVESDIPQMSLLATMPGIGVNNVRRWTIRGIPDSTVLEGEYSPNPNFTAALGAYQSALGVYLFRGRDLSQPQNRITSFDSTGKMTFEGPVTYAPFDVIRVLKTKDVNGVFRGGRFVVSTVGPGSNVLTTQTVFATAPTTGGVARKDLVAYITNDVTNFVPGRVVTRRVGRPFVAYRGRRSKKR